MQLQYGQGSMPSWWSETCQKDASFEEDYQQRPAIGEEAFEEDPEAPYQEASMALEQDSSCSERARLA
jgi:hypothetical protein